MRPGDNRVDAREGKLRGVYTATRRVVPGAAFERALVIDGGHWRMRIDKDFAITALKRNNASQALLARLAGDGDTLLASTDFTSAADLQRVLLDAIEHRLFALQDARGQPSALMKIDDVFFCGPLCGDGGTAYVTATCERVIDWQNTIFY